MHMRRLLIDSLKLSEHLSPKFGYKKTVHKYTADKVMCLETDFVQYEYYGLGLT
jgi:hypothetical protein